MWYFSSLSKSATSSALGWSEIALVVFGVVLAAGLVGEYSKSERLKRRVRLFELMVIVGVVGELVADGGIFLFSRHLQTISDVEIAALNKEAAEARKAAGEANERASANERQAAQLRKEAEDERLSRVNLEQRTANRDLTLKERAALSVIVTPFAGQRAIMDVFPATFEAAGIAGNILGVLLNAHWNVRGFNLLPAPPNKSFGTGAAAPLLVQGISLLSKLDETDS